MRQKSKKLVITFDSTADAMAMECSAQSNGIPGRIIPVPSEISAGCGMSWCADECDAPRVLSDVENHAIAYLGIHYLMMY
ncbi:MAG: DUF3343 domain-containing protein [Eggerthellaceae bacterium]|jgi:hypothetical protein|nr:DUF3343 domain-containing protein [Eggerthellaceae bacterium]MCH4221224.1 DUF3343 domain-containing protein [Eggerthellaceae bacterium]